MCIMCGFLTEEHTKFFDPFFSKKLDESSVIDIISVETIDKCAQLCLNTSQYTCLAYDYKNNTCKLASEVFKTVESVDVDTTHFEMEKFPGILCLLILQIPTLINRLDITVPIITHLIAI